MTITRTVATAAFGGRVLKVRGNIKISALGAIRGVFQSFCDGSLSLQGLRTVVRNGSNRACVPNVSALADV